MAKIYDVLIIGAGPAGLTAAIYTCRKKLSTLIVSMDLVGQTARTSYMENYPGMESVNGNKLVEKIYKQAAKFGADFVLGKKVSNLEKKNKNFTAKFSDGSEYSSKTVILAFGKIPRSLGIPGENEYLGKGLSVCVTCDAPMYSGKITAIIGGGNSALESAVYMASISKKVYLIHRRDEFRGDEITAEKIKKMKNIEILFDTIPVEIKGSEFLHTLIVENSETGERRELKVDGVFSEIGYEVNVDFLNKLVEVNEKNEIIIDFNCHTSRPGIFAAGDATIIPYKQTIIAAGEGAKAALEAYAYIKNESVGIDWGKKSNTPR